MPKFHEKIISGLNRIFRNIMDMIPKKPKTYHIEIKCGNQVRARFKCKSKRIWKQYIKHLEELEQFAKSIRVT